MFRQVHAKREGVIKYEVNAPKTPGWLLLVRYKDCWPGFTIDPLKHDRLTETNESSTVLEISFVILEPS